MNLMNKFLVSCLVLGLTVFAITDSTAKIRPLSMKAKAEAQEEEAKPMGRIAKMVQKKAEKKAKAEAKAKGETEQPKQDKVEPTSEANAIIFRIEDIKPLKNDKDLVDKCTFMVTVFNRMDKEVQEASLDFIWKDDISAKYKIQDDDVKPVAKPEEALTVITKAVTLEKILPHQQKSFEFTVDTDKCFLLLDQLEYKVNSCIAEGDKIVVRNNRRIGTGSCTGRFDYINSKNPEYYSEFKDVPESVLQQQAEEAKKAELAGINDAYETALVSIEEIDEELDKIAEMPEEEEEEVDEEDTEEDGEEGEDGKKVKKTKNSKADTNKSDKNEKKSDQPQAKK